MYTLNCRGRLLVLDQPVVMGIINLTPDSFYAGSRSAQLDAVLFKAEQLLTAGAVILDIGAQSTRPGSNYLTADEEWARLAPVLPTLTEHFPQAYFSVDTFHASVAQQAYEAGVHLINDISFGMLDNEMIPVVAKSGLPYIGMHMKGSPQTMQSLANYDDLLLEITDFFSQRIAACRAAGIKDLILDPGFGFAKTREHNFQLLNRMQELQVFELPLLAGLSRKSMITKTLGITADEALNGTTVLNTVALQKGATILRVHDPKPAVEAIRLLTKLTDS
ncbi:dihydropteroate synthase [Flavihumibacter sp. RY-1]|uniref:dihydropteroate synthase n=1 Tax=Flavihumibacter fluminis TaxID=2909236 RepID=A0ABS9BJG1_9BACT|nr:dihydropteroate synthase [Flavihumibacter fluminis]MCF1715163.1 dihydropteroate synthase [Flavihumibacter fluminis]